MVVKLGQCGRGEAVVHRSSLEPEHGSLVAAVRRSSFARTLQGYISANILFFVGAPVVFVNMFRCEINEVYDYCYLPR